MRYSLILQIFALVALITADDLQPPSCALPCLAAAVEKSGCQTTDYVCQCTTGKDAITASVLPCLSTTKCTNADFAQLQLFSANFCPKILAGGSVSLSGASSSTSSAPGNSPTAGPTSKSSSGSGSGSSSSSSTSSSPSSTATSSLTSNRPSGADSLHRGFGIAISFFAVACLLLLLG